MIEHPNVVPIAVVSAIVLFLVRELLEAFRRWRANSRKLHAVRRFLAVECERNKFAIDRLLSQVSDIGEALTADRCIKIEVRQNGPPRLAIETEEGDRSSPIPLIHTDALNRYLFDAASLNAGLFEQMETTLDALIDAAHVRDGVIEYVADDPLHLEGFVDYADRELSKALEPVGALYFKCTNKRLERGRVR
jgi:hypothetical protein